MVAFFLSYPEPFEKNCEQKAIVPDWKGFRKNVVKHYAACPDYLKYTEELRH